MTNTDTMFIVCMQACQLVRSRTIDSCYVKFGSQGVTICYIRFRGLMKHVISELDCINVKFDHNSN